MKRSKHAIISKILEVCQPGANKTRIVYQANLNFRSVETYIDLLIKNDMIRVDQGKTVIYQTTGRGIDLQQKFKHIESNLSKL